MKSSCQFPRLDQNRELHDSLLPYCRLQYGEIWEDSVSGHRVGCLDASNSLQMSKFTADAEVALALHDPPYNLVAFDTLSIKSFLDWCRKWVENTDVSLRENSSLYVWMGADQNNAFQPLPDFMIMMREFPCFNSRSFLTMRNQRGYGTDKNWMAVRQECLFYTKGSPHFSVQYTDIPKILRGYYKEVNGVKKENIERGKSANIRPGNVWVDIQQVFYRMEENVNGCYAQKPLRCIERIVKASTNEQETVIDFFGHSGTTLIASERLNRRCLICDIDPVYCEIMIRRLERYRKYKLTGWQNGNPFEKEVQGRAVPKQAVLTELS